MSFTDEYNALKKKREEEEKKKKTSSFDEEYQKLKAETEEKPLTLPSPVAKDKIFHASFNLPQKKEEKRTWFDSGAFDDGYQFGDVTKTVFGSVMDVRENLAAGILGMGEKVVDAGAYLAGGVGGLFGADEFKEKTKDFIAKDLYDEKKIAKKIIGIDSWAQKKQLGINSGDSVFGDKADSLVESGGQLLGTMGLQAVGVPWFVTSGVTSFGGEAENAFNQDASYGEAGVSAAISAGSEILTEKLFGGSGLGEKGLINLDGLTKGISSKLFKALADYGVDMAAEGAEEVFSQVASNLGSALYREENLNDILLSEEAIDGYIESFIGGAALGGFANAQKVSNSIKTGKDYRSGMTDNEQKVFDKVYENEVAEAEKNGKLTEKEKAAIYDRVMEDMEKGYISTDTIESILGDKSSYDALSKEAEEFKSLYETEGGKLSEKQHDRLAELKEKNKQNPYEDAVKKSKDQFSQSVFELVKGDRLSESYRQKAYRGQSFQADISQYDAKQRSVIQKAIDSGILNNTRRTHEFVDMVAKISADKGVLFDFTNNEKLKDSGFGVDGKFVNGYFDKKSNSIGVNIDSSKSLNSVVGHEITHVLEGTEVYDALKKTLFDYAKSKGDYQGRYDSLSKMYENIQSAEVEAELTADLVGDYLFTDSEFIHRLSTENRNVFQKIWDEVKYLCKVATAGSKEARELEKVKKIFEEAYRAETKNPTEDGGVRYSVTGPFMDNNGTQYDTAVLLDTEFFDGLSPRNWGGKLRDFVEMRAENEPFILPVLDENGYVQQLQFASTRDRVTKNGQSNHKVLDKLSSGSDNISKLAVIHIDEIVDVSDADTPYHTTGNNHQWLDQNGWLHRTANVINAKNGNIYNLTFDIAKARDGRHILYATNGNVKRVGNVQVSSLTIRGSGQNSNSKNNVAQSDSTVKRKDLEYQYAVNRGDKKTAQKMVDRAARDAGYTIKAYHGTDAETFNEFDKGKIGEATGVSILGDGFYFADNKKAAQQYGKNIYTVYLKQANPYSATAGDAYRLKAVDLEKQGHDSVVLPTGKGNVYMVLDPNQIKSAEAVTYDDEGNVIPLSARFNAKNEDIRYSLSKNSTYAEIEDERQKLRHREIRLEERKRESVNNPELLQAMDDYSNLFTEMRGLLPKKRNGTATQAELDRIEEIKVLRDEHMKRVADLQESLGLNAISKEEAEIRETKEALRVASDAAWAREGAEKENAAIAKAGISAPEYFRKKALKAFKTTSNFNEAGYLLPDGKLLNFSGGERNHRYRDHREIGEIYEATNGVAALNRFLSDGNIRIMAESPGVDLASGVEPTREQYATLRRFINTNGMSDGRFFVDFSEKDGRNVGKYAYQGKVLADRIINDIKYFYQTGIVRESSGLTDFLSISEEGQAHKEYGNWNVYGKDVRYNEIAPVGVAENATTTEGPSGRPVPTSGAPEDIAPWREQFESLTDADAPPVKRRENPEKEAPKSGTRKALHQGIVDNVRAAFAQKGFDFDEVLKKAKNLSTFATVDNTPQRVMEKALGYKEGGILADLTVNKVAQNETEKIKWLNSYLDRKNGLLIKISKQYNIKPESKESAAAQMYAEGFYVNENNEIIAYGDNELAKDFPDAQVQRNIKGLARDERIRKIYDDTLAAINESRARNLYPEIPRLDNYFLHFRAQTDTFSRLGLPFNPNDIRAKDLPTDLNGVTADLKPGQPYFASAKHREGKRTSFDLLGGLEKYLTSAGNQIYHIDDIQTLRALRNHLADTYGQANGLDGLDALSEEEAQERIKEVYSAHLSTFAKFLNEEANILAGKTALIDRGLEGIIGRRGITLLDTINRQAGSNMIGYSVRSALTNFDAIPRAFVKANKADFVKAFGQMVMNKVSGRNDGFAENSPVVIRRKGADRFARNLWQKLSDPGYAFMGKVDEISTELIARAKYNELTRKGMDSQQAHFETDKWVSKLMGDRSLGQQPQLFNSKMLGLFTKFQLEVRNNLDSMFYDSIQEAKVSNEHIQDNLDRNAKTAAKATATIAGLAVAQHLFGKAFESVAGYNPSFDIIEAIIKAFGWDDDEEEPVMDNLEEAFLSMVEDMPYSSTFTGGRIPIQSALPIAELVKGVDQYGNEKSRWETLGEIAPYYLLPGGYGQAKKTFEGLGMFSEDHPISGSYTDSGDLRFPVEKTFGNVLQAGLFGQYASENARDYFDNDWAPLKENQIEEFVSLGMPIEQYREIRKDLSGLKTLAEKADYIDSLDLTAAQKNTLVNNIAGREEDIDMSDYSNYGSFEEFDFAHKNPEKYRFLRENGVSYEVYTSFDEGTKGAYDWAYNNPEKFEVSKAVCGDVARYRGYVGELNDIKADKDQNGNTISGSRKEKVIDYINDMDLDYGAKIILFKSEYEADDTYNYDIIEYLNSREDISYAEMETILKELGFHVDSEGNITWD